MNWGRSQPDLTPFVSPSSSSSLASSWNFGFLAPSHYWFHPTEAERQRMKAKTGLETENRKFGSKSRSETIAGG